ncbi:MAG: hypothetical protein K0Q73_8869 [Paenibacillus sp.]|nr:hypothetical protein [Paenibacillus sp.]
MLLPWSCILYSMSKIFYLGYKNEKRLMEMTFLLFVLIWLGIAPFCQISANHFPWPGVLSYDYADFVKAYAVIGTGIAFYEFGLLSRRKSIPALQNKEESSSKTIQLKPMIFLTVVVLFVTSFLISQYGGFSMFLHSRGESGLAYSSKMESLIVSNLIKVPPLVVLIFMLTYWKGRSGTKPFILILLTIVLLLMNFYISNPVYNPRYWFGTVALALFFTMAPWKRNSYINYAVSFTLVLILIFPYADLFRRSLNAELVISSLTSPLIYKGDYDAFQIIMESIRYVGNHGIDFGRQILGAIFFWFPRSLWYDKPYGTGQTIGESLDFSFTNLSAPLWAEMYVGFGVFGVAVLFYIYGVLSRWMQKRYMEKGSKSLFGVIMPFLAAYQIYLLRGDLMNGMAYLSLFLICSYVFSKFIYRNPERQINAENYRRFNKKLSGINHMKF